MYQNIGYSDTGVLASILEQWSAGILECWFLKRMLSIIPILQYSTLPIGSKPLIQTNHPSRFFIGSRCEFKIKFTLACQYLVYVAQTGGIKQNLFFPLGEAAPQINLNVESRRPGFAFEDFMGDMDIGSVELYSFVVCDRRHGEGDSTPQRPDDHIYGAHSGIPAGIFPGYRKDSFPNR